MVHFLREVITVIGLGLALITAVVILPMPPLSAGYSDVLPYTGPRTPITFQVTLGRPDDIKVACEILTGTRFDACAKFKTEKNLCWVFAPWPDNAEDVKRFALLDHEFGHCVSGAWHG